MRTRPFTHELQCLAFAVFAAAGILHGGESPRIVAADGSAPFSSIQAAIDSITHATRENPAEILIKPGHYFETFTTKDWVNVTGEDRDRCVVTYNRKPEQPTHQAHVIWATTNSTVRNLTLVGRDVKYCIHSDGGKAYTLTVENCVLRREYPDNFKTIRAAFGIGLHAGQHIRLKGCEIVADMGIYFHNIRAQSSPCSFTVDHCAVQAKDEAIVITTFGSKQRDVFAIRDSRIRGSKAAILYRNISRSVPRPVQGENEIEILGGRNEFDGSLINAIVKDEASDQGQSIAQAEGASATCDAADADSTGTPPEPKPALEISTVYRPGEGNYSNIRTPQILVTRGGALLAFAQGRLSEHDQSENDIIVKRSVDGGNTWSPLKIVADAGRDTLNSICVVQVRETGRLIVMGSIIPYGYEYADFRYLSPGMQGYQKRHGRDQRPFLSTGYEGTDIQRSYVVTSDDEGQSWSPMMDVTRSTKNAPPSVWVMPGPGIGIQKKLPPHAGRIIMPCYSRWLNPTATKAVPGETRGSARYECAPYAVYSDDLGKTWQRGELALPGKTIPNGKPPGNYTNETQMVELADGAIMLNSRAGSGRNIARSVDGGRTWSDLQVDRDLKVTETAAGFIRYSSKHDGEKNLLVFSNPAKGKRVEGRIWLSSDEGVTWPTFRILTPGKFSYSTLARLPDGRIGCLFDEGNQVRWARFTLAWLSEGEKDAAIKTASLENR